MSQTALSRFLVSGCNCKGYIRQVFILSSTKTNFFHLFSWTKSLGLVRKIEGTYRTQSNIYDGALMQK